MAWYDSKYLAPITSDQGLKGALDYLPKDPAGTPGIQGSDNPIGFVTGDTTIGPDKGSTAALDQAAADARALEAQFIQQMQQQQPTPGLQFYGSAPVVGPDGQIIGGVPPPTPSPTAGGPPVSAPTALGGSPSTTPAPVSKGFGGGMAAPTGGAFSLGATPGAGPLAGGAAGPSNVPGPYVSGISNPGVPGLPGQSTVPTAVTQQLGPFANGLGPTNNTGLNGGQRYTPPPNAAGVAGGAAGPTAPGMMAAAMQAAAMQAAQMGAGPELTAAMIDQAKQEQFRQGQLGLASSLQDTIAGKTPSVAQLQQNAALDRLGAQQMGLAAAMGRGGNQALAMRTAMGNVGQVGAQQAAASALQRAQETAMAQQQLGAVLGAGRGADIGLAEQQAALQQQAGLTNNQNVWGMNQQNAQLSQQANQANAQFQQAAGAQNAQMLQQANAANQQSQITTRGQNINEQQNRAGQALQANQNQVQAATGQFNAADKNAEKQNAFNSSALSSFVALSDQRLKKDIKPARSDLFREFLAKMEPATWRYKGSNADRVGPMAQDVEKSRVGKTMVVDTPIGKAIDVRSATTAMLGALADMHKRVAAVEKKAA